MAAKERKQDAQREAESDRYGYSRFLVRPAFRFQSTAEIQHLQGVCMSVNIYSEEIGSEK